jgi:hypothetical protein
VYTDNNLPPPGSTAFVGFVSNTPIGSVSFTATNDSWVLQDVVLAMPAPEPAAGLLVLTGLGGVLMVRRRRAHN